MIHGALRMLAAAMALWLSACASVTPAPDPTPLLHDALFEAPTERITAADVFALSDGMQRYVASHRVRGTFAADPRRALVDALFERGELRLEYDAQLTRTAAQAFEARQGNCLSLVIMTAALAREMGLSVRFQQIETEPVWERTGGLVVSVGHINLTLNTAPIGAGFGLHADPLVIDFAPTANLTATRIRQIDERRVVAMYMNNRAVEALTRGRLNDAYGWIRESLLQDPRYVTAVNTLGVIYRQVGALPQAEQAWRAALAQRADDTHSMSNLARLLDQLGQHDEANALSTRLARLQPHPPFAWFDEGVLAMSEGRYARARDLFEREVARAPHYHEFNFWLASAYAQLGDMKRAREQLELARKNSTTRRDHDLYAAKLSRLQAVQTQF